MKRSKKLLVVLDELYYYDGNTYGSKYSWGKFTEAFCPFFDEVTLSVPVKNEISNQKLIKVEKVNFCPLPYWDGMVSYIKNLPKNFWQLVKTIRRETKKHDVIFIRLPSLAGMLFFVFAKLYSKPIALYVGGNIRTAANRLYVGSRISKMTMNTFACIIEFITRIMVNHSITFVTGKELYQSYNRPYNKIFQTMTSLINKDYINERDDTCQGSIINIVCVAQILPSKGIDYLIDAIHLLRKDNYNVLLDIVGFGNGTYYESLVDKVKKLELESYVKFKGYVTFGSDLFEIYRKADISVLATLSEGLPRVIIESWASGIPFIATNVGGIPGLIVDGENGLLINPGSSVEICKAIKRTISNSDLRKKIIRNGLDFAKQHTSDKQAETIIHLLRMCYQK